MFKCRWSIMKINVIWRARLEKTRMHYLSVYVILSILAACLHRFSSGVSIV